LAGSTRWNVGNAELLERRRTTLCSRLDSGDQGQQRQGAVVHQGGIELVTRDAFALRETTLGPV
jgi:hypothetical protein